MVDSIKAKTIEALILQELQSDSMIEICDYWGVEEIDVYEYLNTATQCFENA